MRWAILCAVLLTAATAHARRPREQSAQTPSDVGNFWRDMIDPHADRVAALLQKANQSLGSDDRYRYLGDDWGLEQKLAGYREAYKVLRQARRLAPDNPEVLALLGRVADELGKTREAIDALEKVASQLGPDKAGSEVTGRLGAIYLRLGERDTAIRWLRYAQLSPTTTSSIHLANAFAARGETTAAIDTLLPLLPTTFNLYSYNIRDENGILVGLALAVIYDRDEQRAAAFEILEKMQSQIQQHYTQSVLTELGKLRFAPAEDQHYYQALVYESVGHFIEARAEWAHYAAAAVGSPWRARALEHIAEIDKARRKDPAFKPTQVPTQQQLRRRRIP